MTHNLMIGAAGPAGYASIALMLAVLILLAATILVLTHGLPKAKRTGPVKDGVYESGVEPIGNARRRFHIPFYLVVMLFLLFDVELVFMYPWALVMHQTIAPANGAAALPSGYTPTFLLAEMGIFVAVLLVGYVYAWRKRIFLG